MTTPTPYQLGEAAGLLFKAAGDPTVSYSLVGDLYVTPKGWAMLDVPNALVRGAFDALHEPGAELPFNSDGKLHGHISVIRPEELERIGGPDKLTERGHQFRYTLGPLKEVRPDGWEGVSRVWFISVRSPELERLRRSYGLSSKPNEDKYDFHITIGRRAVNVLKDNDVVKQSDFEAENEKARIEAQSSKLQHVREGYARCSVCDSKYHIAPPDHKCPACGARMWYIRSAKKAERGPPYRCETCTKKFKDFQPGHADKCPACSGDLIPEQTFGEKWPDREFKLAALISIPELDPSHPNYPTHAGPPLGGVSSASCHEPHDAVPSGRADASGDGRPSAGGGGPVYAKEAGGVDPSPLQALLQAKRHSDQGDYRAKHRVLAQLLRSSPQDFAVDQPHPAHPGLTHLPTGFRTHAPFSLASLAAGKVAFAPDYTPAQLRELGVYERMYDKPESRPASMPDWPAHWLSPHDPKGWLQWYDNYSAGRRIPDEDARQMKRWTSFKARHGAQFQKNPTPRRAAALEHWAIDPSRLTAKLAAKDRPVPADANDPADREDCPCCGVMHERGDGYCNSCGGRWPAKTK